MIINLSKTETEIFNKCFNNDLLKINSSSIDKCIKDGNIQDKDKKWIQKLKMNYSKSLNKNEDFKIFSQDKQ